MHYQLHFVLEATRGGPMRKSMLDALIAKPRNAHQLAKDLGIDYKTVQHHIKVLEQNNIIGVVNKGKYGAMYFVLDEMRIHLEETQERFGKTVKKKR